jgi:cytochrome b6-f complex iron-sulfur subunit
MKSDDPEAPSRMGRRDLLRAAVSTGFVLALPMLGEPSQAATGTWVPIGTAEQFKPGTPKRVVLPGGRVAFVTRVGATRLSALSARCTHQGCEVGWDGAKKQFLCPCHGATFTAAGRNIRGPAPRPLDTVPITQRGKQVLVNVAVLPAGGKGRETEEHERDEHGERDERRERDDDD